MNQALMIGIGVVASLPAQSLFALAVVDLSTSDDAPIKQFMVDTNFRNDPLSTRNGTNIDQRTVMYFDFSSIPAGNDVFSATLHLYGHAILGSTDVTSVSLFRITRSWLENEVTYRQAVNFNDWTQLGGDYVGNTGVYDVNPYSTWTGPQSGATDAWYAFDATQLVQEWYVGLHSNQGILLKGAFGNELEYASSESPIVSNRPYLQVMYETVPEPTCLMLLAICALFMPSRRWC
jgi:hypothetical protein